MTCINCQSEHESKFCPECGEKLNVPRITFRSVINEGLSTFTYMDKGFLFNVKNLLVQPKKFVTDYINGRRKNILSPIAFLIFCVTIYLLGEKYIDNFFSQESLAEQSSKDETFDSGFAQAGHSFGYEIGQFLFVYFKYFWILSVLPLSLATRAIVTKYNYSEHLAINSFVIGQASLIGLISHLVFGNSVLFDPLVYLAIFWLTYRIYAIKNKAAEIILQSFGVVFLFIVQLFIIGVIIGIFIQKNK